MRRIGTAALFATLLLSIVVSAAIASDIIPYRQLSESDFTSPTPPGP